MPDIHVFGFPNGPDLVVFVKTLREALQDTPYANNLTIVSETAFVSTLNGERQKFVRVWASKYFPTLQFNDLIRRLVRLDTDVEDDLGKVYHPKGFYRLGDKLYPIEEIDQEEPLE